MHSLNVNPNFDFPFSGLLIAIFFFWFALNVQFCAIFSDFAGTKLVQKGFFIFHVICWPEMRFRSFQKCTPNQKYKTEPKSKPKPKRGLYIYRYGSFEMS